MHRAVAAIAILAFAALAAPAQAQTEPLYTFELTPVGVTTAPIEPGQESVKIPLLFRDLSRDSTTGLAGNPAVPNASPAVHQTSFDFTLNSAETIGWAVTTPTILYTNGGQSFEVEFEITASILIRENVMPLTLIAKSVAGSRTYVTQVDVTVYSLGAQSFNAQPQDLGGEVRPGSIVDVPIRITNGALVPRGFDIAVTSNPCGLQTATSANNFVGPKETKVYTVSARAPEAKPWYFSENCELGIEVAPSDAPTLAKQMTANLVVNGGYVDPQWVIWLVEILVVLVLLIFFILRRKARIEEEILGKPQKPWTIPVEVLYLKALRQKDERAWYVVRHHLMEEEYRSSLLWYKAYKKATKGTRQKETLVLRQEKAYEKWKAGWQKDIAKPLTQADRFEAKLQRKLDRKGRKLDRKDARKVRRLTKKMAAAHAKQVERALEKWQRANRKAEKKGLPLPPRPVLAEPDYPEEPEPRQFILAEHKWAKKAARHRARMVRRQGDLEVKFEKADARQLAKLRRKVQRLARKLDDPDFVAEHPLLRAEA